MRRKLLTGAGVSVASLVAMAAPAMAQETQADRFSRFSEGADIAQTVVLDNIFIFIAAVLAFFMQAGFALVEAGLTRAKNCANIMMKNLMDVSVGVLVFAAVGWGIAYPGDFSIGNVFGFASFGIDGLTSGLDISAEAVASTDFYPLAVPVDFLFQAAFAATAATIVSGAVAGRTNFKGYLGYTVVITGLIYPVVVSWQWGGGWLAQRGFEDFAGSGLVHMTGGVAALTGAAVLGPRIGKFGENGEPRAIPGHSVPLAITGVFILFIGWFGFNPGSQLQADMAVPVIAVLTLFAACAGAVGAMAISWVLLGKPDVSMAGNGMLAGLVAICSGVGVMSAWGSLITGLVAGLIVVPSVLVVERNFKIDDPVGAFSVHGVCGFWGLLATGLLAKDGGLVYGDGFGLFADQFIGGVAIAVFVSITAGALFLGLRAMGILRVSAEDELAGLDQSEHGAPGYGPDILVATGIPSTALPAPARA